MPFAAAAWAGVCLAGFALSAGIRRALVSLLRLFVSWLDLAQGAPEVRAQLAQRLREYRIRGMSGPGNSVDRLVLQFSGLRITIEQGEASASAREPSPADFLYAAGSQTETGPLVRGSSASPAGAGASPDEAFLDAATLAALSALELGPLARFARSLASVGEWSPAARVARAYRAGLSAKAVLEGRTDYQASSLPVPTRNRIYVVARCRAEPQGFVTENFRTFLDRVPKDKVGRLEKFAVCHAFASRSEASAFIEASGRQWPQEL